MGFMFVDGMGKDGTIWREMIIYGMKHLLSSTGLDQG